MKRIMLPGDMPVEIEVATKLMIHTTITAEPSDVILHSSTEIGQKTETSSQSIVRDRWLIDLEEPPNTLNGRVTVIIAED